MGTRVKLDESPYECGRIASKRSFLYGDEKISELSKLSFDEIIKFMEEHDYKLAVNTSYLENDGFYLVERILNVHLSRIYSEIFKSASEKNQILLNVYYLKYQIHNLMAVIKCKLSSEEEIEGYLIGNELEKSKYIKAYNMPIEDGIVYLCKKLEFSSDEVLEIYSKGMYELENYLYKLYYKKLISYKFVYNKQDEKNFFDFILRTIDFLNVRTFLKVKLSSVEEINFEEIFICGGSFKIDVFNDLAKSELKDCIKFFEKSFGKLFLNKNDEELSALRVLDKKFSEHKANSDNFFNKIMFGSPFYILKYLFEAEKEMAKLRVLLKSKYLGLDEDEIKNLIEGEK